ncbi:MAG: dienelactone hydrolase [Myxococcota bacterium]|jgi:dienelactone hydrolase
MFASLSIALSLLLFQNPEDSGAYQVAVQDVNHSDSHYGRGTISARVYYPTNTNDGPFPLVAFMHGWIEPASDYDDFCTHLASWGYVVYSNNTETSIFGTLQAEAADTRAGLQWVEDESQDSTSWLYGMTNNQPWSAIGHSMGAAAVASMCKIDPRVKQAVMFEPYKGSLLGNSTNAFNWFSNFSGPVLVIGGTDDLTNNWSSTVFPWYRTADNSSRKIWALINGGDHFGSTDSNIHGLWGSGSLSWNDQHLIHRRLATSFLQAEIRGDEDLLHDLFNTIATDFEASSTDTPVWAVLDPSNPATIQLGSFSAPNNYMRIAGSTGTGFTQSAFGDILLDMSNFRLAYANIVPPTGLSLSQVPINPSFSGSTLYFQALATDSGLGSTSSLNEVYIP